MNFWTQTRRASSETVDKYYNHFHEYKRNLVMHMNQSPQKVQCDILFLPLVKNLKQFSLTIVLEIFLWSGKLKTDLLFLSYPGLFQFN